MMTARNQFTFEQEKILLQDRFLQERNSPLYRQIQQRNLLLEKTLDREHRRLRSQQAVSNAQCRRERHTLLLNLERLKHEQQLYRVNDWIRNNWAQQVGPPSSGRSCGATTTRRISQAGYKTVRRDRKSGQELFLQRLERQATRLQQMGLVKSSSHAAKRVTVVERNAEPLGCKK